MGKEQVPMMNNGVEPLTIEHACERAKLERALMQFECDFARRILDKCREGARGWDSYSIEDSIKEAVEKVFCVDPDDCFKDGYPTSEQMIDAAGWLFIAWYNQKVFEDRSSAAKAAEKFAQELKEKNAGIRLAEEKKLPKATNL